jgi:cytochrome c peroxidase
MAVAKLITAYVDSLSYEQDEQGRYTGSSYDRFLMRNKLPRQPARGESHRDYSLRLIQAVDKLQQPQYVIGEKQKYHPASFRFGKTELAGMRIFFGRGNCIACHAAPHFSDFKFHNTGISQRHYDQVHGAGAFNKLHIPDLNKRNADYNTWLPATVQHPEAKGPYRSAVNMTNPGLVDLGMWNVFANPDMPRPQPVLRQLLCQEASNNRCTDQALLPMTVARYKTPVLRDPGHSNPYMHNGRLQTLADVINFYITVSSTQPPGGWRNLAPEIAAVKLQADDIKPLQAFLQSLNEDYE